MAADYTHDASTHVAGSAAAISRVWLHIEWEILLRMKTAGPKADRSPHIKRWLKQILTAP